MLSALLIGTITYQLRNGQATSDRTLEDAQLKNNYMKLLDSYRFFTSSSNPPSTTNKLQPTHRSTLQSVSLITQCLPHSSRSTLPRTTRSLETIPLQPCQRHLSKRPTVAPQSPQLAPHLTMDAAGYACQCCGRSHGS
jgi:hypothetical protein